MTGKSSADKARDANEAARRGLDRLRREIERQPKDAAPKGGKK